MEGICGEVDFGVPLLYITVVRLKMINFSRYFSLGSISELFGYERVIGNCEPDKRKIYKE